MTRSSRCPGRAARSPPRRQPRCPPRSGRARRSRSPRPRRAARPDDPESARMTLPELSIQRHVFAVMLNAVLVLFGLDRLPAHRHGQAAVRRVSDGLGHRPRTKGANPDIVDAAITDVIEGSVNSVPGIEHIHSTSSPGPSQIIDHLQPREAHRHRVQRGAGEGEPGGAPPAEGRRPAGGGEGRDQHARRSSGSRLRATAPSSSSTSTRSTSSRSSSRRSTASAKYAIGGRRDRTIRVNLLPARMAAFGIAAQDITDAFGREHMQLAGRLPRRRRDRAPGEARPRVPQARRPRRR